MSKKLNIIEAMKMPIGTEFEVLKKDGTKDICNVRIIKASERENSKKLVVDNRAYIEIIVGDFISNAAFIPVQRPISFTDAIKASEEGKIIRCKIETQSYIYHPVKSKWEGLREDRTNTALSPYEILEGKWYIEESESEE